MSFNKIRGVEPRTWFVIPLAGCVFFGLGGFFSVLTSTHHWGIAAVLILLVYIFFLGFVAIHAARLARVKIDHVGFLCGAVLGCCYIAGELFVAKSVEQVSVSQWYSGRWNEGYELFGAGSYAIKGWVWAIAYGSRLLLVVLVLATAMLTEGGRQFCESCKSSTTRTRWKAIVKAFDPLALGQVKRYNDLMKLVPTPNAPEGVWVRVRTCKCTNFGEIVVDRYAIENGTRGSTLIEAVPISPIAFARVIDWVQEADPNAELPGEELNFDQLGENRELFDRPVEPEEDEWDPLIRWDGAGTAMEWRCDTLYTRALRSRLLKGEYQVVEEALALAQNINDRACIYEAAGDWPKAQDWNEIWCEEDPQSTQAHTVAGINLVKQAWIKRGSGWTPKHVPEFMGLLNSAMESLDRAIAIDPENAVAHAWKIYAGKGLGQEDERVRSYFDAATRSHPDFHGAHWMYFDYLTPKWYGSEERCIGFAREVLKNQGAGSAALGVVAYAHFEIARERMEKDKKGGFMGYLNQPEVRSDIVRANELAFRDHRMSMVTPRVRAFFAYMLWQLGETQGAKGHMEIIGKNTPWDPFSASVFFLSKETYTKARKACGL